jgi:hypothetical protein
MLIARALHVGDGYEKRALIVPTLIRSTAFLVIVTILTVIEEVVLGVIHHRSVWDGLGEIGGGTYHQLIATTVLLFLIFVPYFAFRSLGEVVGEHTLLRLYFEPRGHQRVS